MQSVRRLLDAAAGRLLRLLLLWLGPLSTDPGGARGRIRVSRRRRRRASMAPFGGEFESDDREMVADQAELAAERTAALVYHCPLLGYGHVVRAGDHSTWVPMPMKALGPD